MLRTPIPLGQSPTRRRPLRTLLLLGLLGAAAAGWLRGHAVPASLQPLLNRLHPAAAPAQAPAPVAAAALTPPPVAPAPPPPPADRLKQAGLERVDVKIDGPLESALDDAVGPPPRPQLAEVVPRALVWWLEVPSALRRGDRLEILFQRRGEEEPALHALRFHSGKVEKVLRAYRFQAQGDA